MLCGPVTIIRQNILLYNLNCRNINQSDLLFVVSIDFILVLTEIIRYRIMFIWINSNIFSYYLWNWNKYIFSPMFNHKTMSELKWILLDKFLSLKFTYKDMLFCWLIVKLFKLITILVIYSCASFFLQWSPFSSWVHRVA